jgi:hypothetical protein
MRSGTRKATAVPLIPGGGEEEQKSIGGRSLKRKSQEGDDRAGYCTKCKFFSARFKKQGRSCKRDYGTHEDAAHEPSPAVRLGCRGGLGRNDLCPCGSEKTEALVQELRERGYLIQVIGGIDPWIATGKTLIGTSVPMQGA